jgi:hypothetical protein
MGTDAIAVFAQRIELHDCLCLRRDPLVDISERRLCLSALRLDPRDLALDELPRKAVIVGFGIPANEALALLLQLHEHPGGSVATVQ